MSFKRVSNPVSNRPEESRLYTTLLRIRMLQPPTAGDCDLQGFEVSRFEVGKVYEVGPRLAELLIVCGYAEPEMRQRDRAADQNRRPK